MKHLFILFCFLASGCDGCKKYCVEWERRPTGKECVESHTVSIYYGQHKVGNTSVPTYCTQVICDKYEPCFRCVRSVPKKEAPAEKVIHPDGLLCPGILEE